MISFSELMNAYPHEDRRELFQQLGGEWPNLVDDPSYKNTCAIRLSVALKKSGVIIPDSYKKEGVASDGTPIIVTVKTMSQFVSGLLGDLSWGMSKNPGSNFDSTAMPKFSGIVAYHVKWLNATGHFDLWTGHHFVGSGKFEDVKDGFGICLWEVK